MYNLENKSCNGIQYSRYIASWINSDGIGSSVYITDWLESLGLDKDTIREIEDMYMNGKLELELDAKEFIRSHKKSKWRS